MTYRRMRAIVPILIAILSQPAVAATCDAANTYTFNYSDQPAATLTYGSTYSYNASNGGGATRPFTVRITQNGMSSTQVAGQQMPNISTMVTGPDATKRDLVVGGTFSSRTASMAGTTRVAIVTFTFATPIHSFALVAHDVDFVADQYRDWVQVTGSDGAATYTPVLTTPWGTGNNGTLPHTSASSSATVGATTTPLSLSTSQLGGNAAAPNSGDTGTFTASFQQPVNTITFKYGNYRLTGTETTTGQQAMGIAGISFCPMPTVTLSKSSTPANGTYGAFNIPENDVIYSITVSNSAGSTVDGNSIVITDPLPAGTTFRNSAFDGTTSLPIKISGATGVSLTAGNIAYRQSASSTFTYTPASGYDPQVAEIRITPSGELKENSSFTVQFRAKIN